MDFAGRPVKRWLYLNGAAIASDDVLARWVGRCLAHAAAAPPKKKAASKRLRGG